MTITKQTTRVVADLRRRLDGAVLVAGQPGYDQSRTPHFAARVGHPVAVVRPRHAADVATAVLAAREHDVPLSVRGGGHHAAGHSTGDGVLVDLGSLANLEIGVDGATAWAQSGLTSGAVTRVLGEHRTAVGFGDTGSVGIGGLTLGGGLGFLSRRQGLTIDQLLAAEMVTADGSVRTVDADREPDLFWAIRGGGGNFGIATRFHYRTEPLPATYGGVLLLPPSPRAIARLMAVCADATDELSVIVSVMPVPPVGPVPEELHGRLVIMARVCYAGDIGRAIAAVRPLRDVAPVVLDTLAPIPYARLLDEPAPSKGEAFAVRSMFVHEIGEDQGDAILHQLARTPAWMRMVQLRVLGGAIARVDPAATAFAHRRSRIMVTVAANGEPDLAQAEAWVEGLGADLDQGDPGAYVGFFGPRDADRLGAAYPPATLARLRRIKSAYDPDNLFRHNDNITPAG